jgi:hypothetical protein
MRTFFRKGLTLWGGATQDWGRFLAEAQAHVLAHPALTGDRYLTHVMEVFDAQRAFELYARPSAGQLKVALVRSG